VRERLGRDAPSRQRDCSVERHCAVCPLRYWLRGPVPSIDGCLRKPGPHGAAGVVGWCLRSARGSSDRRARDTSRARCNVCDIVAPVLHQDSPTFKPYLEEGVAHGFCAEAINTSFQLVGRIGVFICVHRSETKVTMAMPEDATPTEAAAAYDVARVEGDRTRLASQTLSSRAKTKRKRRR
jgi:hypothetical protein